MKSFLTVKKINIPLITLDAAVIGSGCAGFNAADWLYTLGCKNIALITEGVNSGTSRNTGSDKQTYYKLTLAGDGTDSVASMAADLFAGRGVNGDTALAEAAGSVRSFIKLCNLGVPFPTNEFGEYAGYKTDHDPRQRATSAGPLTSKMMTEALESAVKSKNITILDGLTAVKLLVNNNCAEGVICLDRARLTEPSQGLVIIKAQNIILATGGPAICYNKSVYPESQTGMSGMALEAGAEAANLQEWQYGLASLKFRWNVSGTYQQVLPKYISVDSDGTEREFLLDYYKNPCEAADMVFLKGYQWPFDTKKITGSSLIDIFVYRETEILGRRVFMDYRSNPTGFDGDFSGLGDEAREYLEKSGALFGTPIQRLEKMNAPAIELYRANGIDLYNEPLEIGVCAQHHNGGIAVDLNWQTSISGLYAAGEAAGTFGSSRPGGSALNSTQVGSVRAAEHIVYGSREREEAPGEFEQSAQIAAGELLDNFENSLNNSGESQSKKREFYSREMSRIAAYIRDADAMEDLAERINNELIHFYNITLCAPEELAELMKTRDMLITQAAVLSAMLKAAKNGSKGSALMLSKTGERVCEQLELCYSPEKPTENQCLITKINSSGAVSEYKPVREIPDSDGWFENVWNDYRRRTGVTSR